MRNRRHLLSDHEGTREIWPAFTDVMSTLSLILFVLVLLTYVRSLTSSKRLQEFQRQIDASEQQLRALHGELQAGRVALAASLAKLHDQQAVIAESDQQLDTLRSQLQSIAVLRVGVLNKVKAAIEAQLGPTHDGRRGRRDDRRQRQHRHQRKPGVRVQLLQSQEGREAASGHAREGPGQRPGRRGRPCEHRHDRHSGTHRRARLGAAQLGPVGQARDGGPRLPLRREHDARRLVRELLLGRSLFEVSPDQSWQDRSSLPGEPSHRDRRHSKGRQRSQGHRRLHEDHWPTSPAPSANP